MAALIELFKLRNASVLRNRVAAACWNAVKPIILEPEDTPGHEARLSWALRALNDNGEGSAIQPVFRAVTVLLQNSGNEATDTEIQTAVNSVVQKLASLGV